MFFFFFWGWGFGFRVWGLGFHGFSDLEGFRVLGVFGLGV